MHIVGICGSIRKQSTNLKFLEALRDLLPAGHRLDVATLGNIPMFNPDIADLPDSVQTLCQSLLDADRVIFAIAEYNYSITGCLKNALDWISRHPGKPLAGKRAAIMGASPGKIGTARAQYHLRQIGVFMDVQFINKPEVMIGECMTKLDDNGKITDEATVAHLKKMLEAL